MYSPHQWSADALPVGKTLDQLLYDIRRSDHGENLMLDSVSLADIMEGSDGQLVLDALVVPFAKLDSRMVVLKNIMDRTGQTVKTVGYQVTAPFMQRGVANVAALFELSDGQTVSIYFHNPDVTPKTIASGDEMISWRWLLNKKDITIVVAPEHGTDLNPRDVIRRVMRLAEKNSPAFQRTNAKRSETMQRLGGLKEEIAQLEVEFKAVQHELEIAKVEADDRFAKAAAEADAAKARAAVLAQQKADRAAELALRVAAYDIGKTNPQTGRWNSGGGTLIVSKADGDMYKWVVETSVQRTITNTVEAAIDWLGGVLMGMGESELSKDQVLERLKLKEGVDLLGVGAVAKQPDAKTPDALWSEYQAMKAQNPKSLLALRAGDFYEFMGDDAKTVASALGLTLTSRNAVPMAGVPLHSLERYLSDLSDKGFEVAVAERNGKGVSRIVRPGSSQTGATASMTQKPSGNEALVYGLRSGQTERYTEELLAAIPVNEKTDENINRVKETATKDGWHSFRVANFSQGEAPQFGKNLLTQVAAGAPVAAPTKESLVQAYQFASATPEAMALLRESFTSGKQAYEAASDVDGLAGANGFAVDWEAIEQLPVLDSLFPEIGSSGYLRGVIKRGAKAVMAVSIRGDGAMTFDLSVRDAAYQFAQADKDREEDESFFAWVYDPKDAIQWAAEMVDSVAESEESAEAMRLEDEKRTAHEALVRDRERAAIDAAQEFCANKPGFCGVVAADGVKDALMRKPVGSFVMMASRDWDTDKNDAPGGSVTYGYAVFARQKLNKSGRGLDADGKTGNIQVTRLKPTPQEAYEAAMDAISKSGGVVLGTQQTGAEPADIPANQAPIVQKPEPTPAPTETTQMTADKALFQSVIDGTVPDILAVELGDQLEAAYYRHAGNPEMDALFEAAVNAYGEASLAASADL